MDVTLARIIHVASVILWIGGVGFVSTVLMPAVRRSRAPEDRLATFLNFESAFAPQARVTVALAGLSGLYMTWKLDAWARFASADHWWMHAMLGLWLAFALMLFILEPFVLHRRLARVVASDRSAPMFQRMERFHQIMLVLSLITVGGAIAGSHGLL